MYFCEPCQVKKHWPTSIFKSYGKCEICGTVGACNDVPSKYLPDPPKPPQTWSIPAEPGPEVTHVRDRYGTVWARGVVPRYWEHFEPKGRTPTWPWDIFFTKCYPLTDVSAEYSIDRDLLSDVE